MVGSPISASRALAPEEAALIRSALIMMAERDERMALCDRSLVERLIDRLDAPAPEPTA